MNKISWWKSALYTVWNCFHKLGQGAFGQLGENIIKRGNINLMEVPNKVNLQGVACMGQAT